MRREDNLSLVPKEKSEFPNVDSSTSQHLVRRYLLTIPSGTIKIPEKEEKRVKLFLQKSITKTN